MTQKAGMDGKNLCNSNKSQRGSQSKIHQEETPRRSARLNPTLTEGNSSAKSKWGAKRSRIINGKKSGKEQESPDELMSDVEYTPNLKRVRVKLERVTEKSKNGKNKDACAVHAHDNREKIVVDNNEIKNDGREMEGGRACTSDSNRDDPGEIVSKLMQNLVLEEQPFANGGIKKDKILVLEEQLDANGGTKKDNEITKTVETLALEEQPIANGGTKKDNEIPKTPSMIDKGGCWESEVTQKLNSTRKDHDLLNQMPPWNPEDSSHVLAVKSALHLSTTPETLICRENEQKRVFEFCKMCIEQGKAGSLYVCGCPGTGKSLLMEKLKLVFMKWAKEAGMPSPYLVAVNCTSLRETSDIFRRILEQCEDSRKHPDSVTPFQELKSLLCERRQASVKKMMLLILDEMDYLITKDQSVIYDLFSLAALPHSYCMLIGVANAIELADRFLPKLQSLNCKPVIVTFRAYSKDQILKILQQRLMVLPYKVFQPQALELCARKVAAASGDMRKALHVCRGAIEMLEAELRHSASGSNTDSNEKTLTAQSNSPPEGSLMLKLVNMVRVDHMARALARTFRSAVVDTIQSLPQHQQIVLCSAVKLFRHGKKDATLGELNAAYLDLCKTTSMNSLTVPEFSSICRVLSDQALLNLGQSREDRLRRVTLKVDEADVIFALQGIRFFRNCLQ